MRPKIYLTLCVTLFTFILTIIGLTACGSGGGGGGGGEGGTKTFDEWAAMVKNIDVSGAQGIMLTGNRGAVKAALLTPKIAGAKAADDTSTLEENSIYKVTDDGRLQRVPVTDEHGNEVPRGTVRPFGVRDLDALYAVFWFWIDRNNDGFTQGAEEVLSYLVHKPTGLAYRADGVITSFSFEWSIDVEHHIWYTDLPDWWQQVPYDRDAAGNLYYQGGGDGRAGVFMIDGSGLGSGALTARELNIPDSLSAVIDGEKDWAIDTNGTFMVYTGMSTDNSTVSRFLDIASGVLTNLVPLLARLDVVSPGGWFRGSNGKLYFIGTGIHCSCTEVLMVEGGTDGSPVITTIGPLSGTWGSNKENAFVRTWPGGHFKRYSIGGKEIILEGSMAMEVFPDQAKVFVHDLPNNELSRITGVQVSGNFIFYFGTSKTTFLDVVLRYDPISLTVITFGLDANFDMDLNRVKVFNNDTIWFEAVRLSDQATVLGEMASDGTVTVHDVRAADEPELITMVAIHPTDFLVINGDIQDWPEDARTQSDKAGDATIGDDLRYYSEKKSSTSYFGLVEFEGNKISSSGITRITIDDTYQIRIGSSSAKFRNLVTGTSGTLTDSGGIAAQGIAVEFSIPLTAISPATLTDIKVARVKEDLFGDVNIITPVLKGTNWELTIGMATPLGDATVEIALTGSYVLRFNKTSAVIDDGVVQRDITTVGGSISYPANDGGDIVVVIPETTIGSPVSLSPTEQSSGEIFDFVVDVMGN
jgi:hypothetical protein